MLFYIKTTMPPNVIAGYLKYYMNMYSYYFKYDSILLNKYLSINYKITLPKALDEITKWVKITEFKANLYQIRIDSNYYVGKFRLNDIANLLEYGNLQINAPKIISNLINLSLQKVRNTFGGE